MQLRVAFVVVGVVVEYDHVVTAGSSSSSPFQGPHELFPGPLARRRLRIVYGRMKSLAAVCKREGLADKLVVECLISSSVRLNARWRIRLQGAP